MLHNNDMQTWNMKDGVCEHNVISVISALIHSKSI